jgi:type I restriction enzyme S subunit
MIKQEKRAADFADDTDGIKKSAPSSLSAVNSPAAKGRKKAGHRPSASDDPAKPPAALGHEPQNTSSPEGPKEGGELPKGWRWESLAYVAADGAPILYGILQPGPDLPDGVPYVRPTEIVEDVIDLSSIRRTTPTIAGKYRRSVLKPDDIILSIVGTIGKVALVPPDLDGGNITQSSVRVRTRSDVVSSRYIAWALRSPVLRRQFDKHRLGTAVPRLNVAHVRALRVPVAPLPEQRRIVAEIEKQFTRLEAGVAALRRVQANLKRYRAAVLKAACEGKLVPTEADLARQESRIYETGAQLLQHILAERRKNWTGRGKYKEPAAPDNTNLPPLPEGWAWASGEKLFAWSSGEGLSQKELQEGAYPVYGGNGVTGYHSAFVAGVPTLVIGRVGAHCGNVYLTDGPAWITDNAIYAVQTPSCVAMRFIRLAFARAELNKRAAGSGQPFVNQRMLNETIIPLPPLAEQTRIVAEVERRLSVVEELETVVSANLQRATRLRNSILQMAFMGKLA